MLDAEFIVAIGFVIFVCLMVDLGMHGKINSALDARAARISAELGEAARLRAEAEAVLTSFELRCAEAQAEAAAVVAQAHAEAERLAGEARTRMTEFLQNRT